MRAVRLILAAGAGLALAACQTATGPAETIVTAAAATESEPVDVAVPISENPAEGVTENQFGGEVPEAKPAGDVDDGGLGDVP